MSPWYADSDCVVELVRFMLEVEGIDGYGVLDIFERPEAYGDAWADFEDTLRSKEAGFPDLVEYD